MGNNNNNNNNYNNDNNRCKNLTKLMQANNKLLITPSADQLKDVDTREDIALASRELPCNGDTLTSVVYNIAQSSRPVKNSDGAGGDSCQRFSRIKVIFAACTFAILVVVTSVLLIYYFMLNK